MRPHLYTFESIMPFGKYKGLTLQSIYNKNASYLEWVLDNIPEFTMSGNDIAIVRAGAHEEWHEREMEHLLKGTDNTWWDND